MRQRALLLLLGLLALGAATIVEAGWREDYVSGIQAVDKSRWSEVASAMELAIAGNPSEDSKTIRIYGMRFEPYIPHFYLGLARYRLGDCEGALAAWEVSLSGGVVQGTPRGSELTKLREECLAKRPTPAPATATPAPRPTSVPTPSGPDPTQLRRAIEGAQRELDAAAEAQQRVVALRSAPALAEAWRVDRSLVEEHQRAASEVEAARTRFNRAREASDLAGLAGAEQAARQARAVLEGLPARVEAVRAAEEQRQLDAVRPTATPQPTPTVPLPTPTLPPLPTATPIPLPTARPGGPPVELVGAVASYLQGDPARVVELLEQPEYASPRVAAVAHLVRAAAYWMLYREGGGEDASLRAQAAADVVRCRELDRGVEPDARAFSPDFVEFFRQPG